MGGGGELREREEGHLSPSVVIREGFLEEAAPRLRPVGAVGRSGVEWVWRKQLTRPGRRGEQAGTSGSPRSPVRCCALGSWPLEVGEFCFLLSSGSWLLITLAWC